MIGPMSPTDEAYWLGHVTSAIRVVGEPERVAAARADKRSQLEFLAVRIPQIRRIVRNGFDFYSFDATDSLAIWSYIWRKSEYHEVKTAALMYYQLQGLSIAIDSFEAIKTWKDEIENWAHCDGLAAIYANLCDRYPEATWEFLRRLTLSADHWSRRAAIVSLIHYSGRNALYLESAAMFELIETVCSDENFYTTRAIAWVLREVAKSRPDDAVGFITRNADRFAPATLRLTVARVREFISGSDFKVLVGAQLALAGNRKVS